MLINQPDTPDLWAGVDVGTQSLRVLVVDSTGALVGAGSRPLTSHRGAGIHEQDPQQWWRALGAACRQAMRRRGPGRRAAPGWRSAAPPAPCCSPRRTAGARTPALMYDDARAGAEAAEAPRRARRCGPRSATGCSRSWALPKLLWLLRHEPAGDARTPRRAAVAAATSADYLTARLVGAPVADRLQPRAEDRLRPGRRPLAQRRPRPARRPPRAAAAGGAARHRPRQGRRRRRRAHRAARGHPGPRGHDRRLRRADRGGRAGRRRTGTPCSAPRSCSRASPERARRPDRRGVLAPAPGRRLAARRRVQHGRRRSGRRAFPGADRTGSTRPPPRHEPAGAARLPAGRRGANGSRSSGPTPSRSRSAHSTGDGDRYAALCRASPTSSGSASPR